MSEFPNLEASFFMFRHTIQQNAGVSMFFHVRSHPRDMAGILSASCGCSHFFYIALFGECPASHVSRPVLLSVVVVVNAKGARGVCERALKAVSFREEQERFNLWVSLINLEHKFGSAATLKAASERACQNCNPKKVYLHMAEVSTKGSKVSSMPSSN